MKNKRLSKKVLSLILSVIMLLSVVSVGTFTADALHISDDAAGVLFFDNSSSGWSGDYIYFVASDLCHKIFKMNKIDGTQLYYLNLSDITNGESVDVDGCWFVNCSSEPDDNLAYDISHYEQTVDMFNDNYLVLNYTAQIDSFENDDEGTRSDLFDEESAICKADCTEPGTSVTSTWYMNNNDTFEYGIRKEIELTVQVDNGSGTYVDADLSNSGGTVNMECYAFEYDNEALEKGDYTSRKLDDTSSIYASSVHAVRATDTTFSLISINAGCQFVGWYDSDGNVLSTDTSYSFNCSSSGQYYARFKVPAETLPSTISATIQDVNVMFKGTSLSYLTPTMTLTDSAGTSTEYPMQRSDYIGTYINGAYQFYWYEAYIPAVTVGNNYKITFKTAGSNMEASMNLDFTDCPSDHIMYFGVDNLQTGTVLENLSDNETAKSCFRSSVNMFTNVAGDSYDPTLTLAQVNVTANSSDGKDTVAYVLGDCDMNSTLNIKDATKIQAMLAKVETANSTEELLADFDVSGNAEIRDVTYLQMYLAKI